MQDSNDAALLNEADELAQRLGGPAEHAWVSLVRGIVLGATGDLADLQRSMSLMGDAVPGFRAANAGRGELYAQFMLGLALGVMGERQRCLARLDDCIARASQWGERYWRSWALWTLALVEVGHDPERAEAAGKEALGFLGRIQDRTGMAMGIAVLAWVNTQQGRHSRAATLFGAAAALWGEVGVSPDTIISYPLRMTEQQYVRTTRAALGDDGYNDAFQRGFQLPQQQAVDYALENVRTTSQPREEEKSPLTQRELQVAELVHAGLSNKEIAARLVIAPRTAETHVEHIRVKLGFTTRAQVAAWYTAHNPAPPQ